MITFYPTISRGEFGKYVDVSRALLPASSWARDEVSKYGRVRKHIPVPCIPECMVDVAADCGGFVATRKWGDYRYTPEQYIDWLQGFSPSWAAMMDYCCENELTSGQAGIVRERQQKTTDMAWKLWSEYKASSWAWVPTIQGWHVGDYLQHAREMKPLIPEVQAYYEPTSAFRVGTGTLCARASAAMIREVVWNVARELPGVPLHLWGVKLSVLQSPIQLPEQVVSVDSGAWNGMWGQGRELWKQSPYTQREWCFKVALPAYEAKIQAALLRPKQMSFDQEEIGA